MITEDHVRRFVDAFDALGGSYPYRTLDRGLPTEREAVRRQVRAALEALFPPPVRYVVYPEVVDLSYVIEADPDLYPRRRSLPSAKLDLARLAQEHRGPQSGSLNWGIYKIDGKSVTRLENS